MNDDYCSESFTNNLGHRSFSKHLCYPVIDAVYTWVNGSDPVWLKEMLSYKERVSGSSSNATTSDSFSMSRFRESDELKYSLRSIEKYAPWIRKVFIVTNGQIPSWLDTNNPKVTIVTHDQIFTNKSNLPTFSSAAIELNLHRIPGLADNFIYFNDDVFLGQPVYPYDFYTLDKGQIMYYSWEVPQCSNTCFYENLGDGVCDAKCYSKECFYDLGDCTTPPDMSRLERSPSQKVKRKAETTHNRCSDGCPFLWIGDGSCDKKCNVEECGYDAYDCSENKNQTLNPHFVRFVSITPDRPDHPLLSYLRETYEDRADVELNRITYVGRVSINAEGSFVSIDLSDLSRLGYVIKSVEILNDTMIYSSVYNSFFHELILVWKPETRLRGISFSVNCIITANIQGDTDRLFLEIIRVPFWELSSQSQLLRFQYDANDRDLTDKAVLVHRKDAFLCQSLPYAEYSSRFVVAIRNRTTSSYYYDPNSSTLHELYDNGTIHSSTVQEVKAALFSDPLPAIDLGQSLIYAGNLSSFTLISRKQHISSLPVGSFSEVNEAIRHIPLIRRYRHLCYSLFRDMGKKRPIRSDEVVSRTIPYLKPSILIDDVNSFAARLWRNDADLSFFSTYSQLSEHDLNIDSKTFFARPLLRTITCHVNTSHFISNPYYRQRMENITVVDGVLLKDHDQGLEGNETIYEVEKEGIKELRYVIDVDDKEEDASFVLSIPSDEVVKVINDRCVEEKINDEETETIEPKEEEIVHSQEETSVEGQSNVSESLTEKEEPIEPKEEENQAEEAVNSRRLSEDPILHYIMSHPDKIDYANSYVQSLLRSYLNITSMEDILKLFSSRRLRDTYHDSLVYTNIILIQQFGNEDRYVPAHMPHFINKQILAKIESKIGNYFTQTISHRFRSSDDLQFALMYFYFLKHFEEEKDEAYYDSLWSAYLDTDHNGVLDENELRTLVAMVYEEGFSDAQIEELRECLSPKRVTTETYTIMGKTVTSVVTEQDPITFERYKHCSKATEAVKSRFSYSAKWSKKRDEPVAFQMLGDDYKDVLSQLNSIRQRQSKFICLNDNISNMTEPIRNALHDFYESFFPYPSQFEKVFERRLVARHSSYARYLWVVIGFFLVGFLGLFYCHL